MKAKIKKGVKPFGGRTFKVLELIKHEEKERIIVEAGPKRGTFGYFSDPRIYYEGEYILIEEH